MIHKAHSKQQFYRFVQLVQVGRLAIARSYSCDVISNFTAPTDFLRCLNRVELMKGEFSDPVPAWLRACFNGWVNWQFSCNIEDIFRFGNGETPLATAAVFLQRKEGGLVPSGSFLGKSCALDALYRDSSIKCSITLQPEPKLGNTTLESQDLYYAYASTRLQAWSIVPCPINYI